MANLLESVGRFDAEISVVLVDDARIQELNRVWRHLDCPTDVLSWPQEHDPLPGSLDILGDVVISEETAGRQAAARNWTLEEEIALLLVHGVLHLLGYEDETEAGAQEMRVQEATLLGRPLEKVNAHYV